MKRKALALTFILTILFSAVAQSQILDLALANPYWDGGYTTPPEDVQKQTITIMSPHIKTVYKPNNLTLSFNVSLNSTNTWYHIHISRVYYKTSWQNNSVYVYTWSHNEGMNPYDDDPYLTEFLYEGNLTDIPKGIQNITVIAYATGFYIKGNVRYRFGTNITSSVIFVINNASESCLTMPFINGVITVAVIGTGLVYFKKRKH